jgi:hypothetical protein
MIYAVEDFQMMRDYRIKESYTKIAEMVNGRIDRNLFRPFPIIVEIKKSIINKTLLPVCNEIIEEALNRLKSGGWNVSFEFSNDNPKLIGSFVINLPQQSKEE